MRVPFERLRTSRGGVVAVVVVLALTGCGSQAAQPTYRPTVTVVQSASASPNTTATATRTVTAPSPTASSDPDRPAGQCPDDVLGVSIRPDPGGGGLGSSYYDLLFTNTGGESCVLRGAPGVSVVGGGNGTQIGPPADRNEGGTTTLNLRAGGTVQALLRVTNIQPDGGPLDGCTVRKGDGYRVYPPHSTRAFLVRDAKAVGCADGPSFMGVDAVKAL